MNEWIWYGNAAHICVSRKCRFHLTTKVGDKVVSTVGEYHPDPDKDAVEVGCGRKYETMVFAITGYCECGCGLPMHDGNEVDFDSYNSAEDANAGHLAMCEKHHESTGDTKND